eukprot:scaffold8476_cov39-Tisochrysis_lutea.AAC.3
MAIAMKGNGCGAHRTPTHRTTHAIPNPWLNQFPALSPAKITSIPSRRPLEVSACSMRTSLAGMQA